MGDDHEAPSFDLRCAAVDFGTTPATSFTVVSATTITADDPAGTGVVDVTVTTSGGTSATSPADQFTYTAAPTVTSISPTSGPQTGGTLVTITGASFTAATSVDFGTTPATSFTVVSPTTITADDPAGTGVVNVTVTTPGGTSATSPADQFTYVAAPTVTSIRPTSGPLTGGTTVTITGTILTGATAVDFGITPATSFTVLSATTITADDPAGSGVVNVTVTTAGGTSPTSPADQFSYVPAPTLTSINPTSAFVGSAATTITLTGTNFVNVSTADFNGTPLTTTFDSATQLTAVIPSADLTTASSAAITVVTTGPGGGTSAAQTFTVGYNPNVVFTSGPSGTIFTVQQVVLSGVDNLQTLENGTVVGTQPLASIASYTLNGAPSVPNGVIIALGSGGFFTLPGNAPIEFQGKCQAANNFVQVTGGTLKDANLTYTNGTSGVGTVVNAATNSLLYFAFSNTQFADLSNNSSIGQLSFTLPNTAASITLTDNGTGAVSGLSSINNAVPTTFKDPTTALFLVGGSGGNAINLVRTAATTAAYVVDAVGGHNELVMNLSDTSANDVDFVTATAVDSTVLGGPIYYQASGGDFSAGGVVLTLGSGNDFVSVQSTSAEAITTVQTGQGNNTVLVSSVPTTTSGTLSGLAGVLSVRAGTGKNQLSLSNAAATVAETYYVTNKVLTGNVEPFTVYYTGNFAGGINLVSGSGNNIFNVLSQAAATPTAFWAGTGNSTFNVSVTTSSAYQLTVVGGSGTNILGVFETSGGGTVTKHAINSVAGTVVVSYTAGSNSDITYNAVQEVGSNATIH